MNFRLFLNLFLFVLINSIVVVAGCDDDENVIKSML
jgi:hypothetical protein